MNNKENIEKLYTSGDLPDDGLISLITIMDKEDEELIYSYAREVREKYYGKEVYLRGLIEFSNYCKNDCKYCGIRRSNENASRYRLSTEEILECCDKGYALGFRTFVLQSGEDLFYTNEKICDIVSRIKANHPDCAVTLSIGEKTRRNTRLILMPGQTGIFFAKRPQIRFTMESFIHRNFPSKIGNSVFMI